VFAYAYLRAHVNTICFAISDDSKLCSPFLTQNERIRQLDHREVALREASLPCYILTCAEQKDVV